MMEGEVDLSSELYGEIFEPLKDISFFKSIPSPIILQIKRLL